MSIAHEKRIADLESRVETLAQKLGGMSKIEMLAHIAQLELRIERLESRGKPGPKPKDAS